MGHQDYLGVMGMFCILIMVEVSIKSGSRWRMHPSSLLEDANEEFSVLWRRKHLALWFQREGTTVVAGCMNTSICLPTLARGRCDMAKSC